MIPRRHLVTGGVFGVLGALAGGEAVAATPGAAAAEVSDETVGRIVRAINDLRADVQSLRAFPELSPVRDAQVAYLRANGKFPDYVEVGITVWLGVHDWHVRWQQPLALGRDLQGRSTIILNQTTIIMRTDVAGSFVGLPYDNR